MSVTKSSFANELERDILAQNKRAIGYDEAGGPKTEGRKIWSDFIL